MSRNQLRHSRHQTKSRPWSTRQRQGLRPLQQTPALAQAMLPYLNRRGEQKRQGSRRRNRPHRQALLTSARNYLGRAGDEGKIR
jgi:hypothetical protein